MADSREVKYKRARLAGDEGLYGPEPRGKRVRNQFSRKRPVLKRTRDKSEETELVESSPAQASKVHKSCVVAKGPDEHHRAEHSSASTTDEPSFQHKCRDLSTALLPQRTRQPHLALPPPSDPDWKNINTQLDITLRNTLTKSYIDNLSPQDAILTLENTVYDFFQNRYGVVTPKAKPLDHNTRRAHTGMQILRTTKKSLRKCFLELKFSGLENTPDAIKVKKQWAAVTRKMNKLRVQLRKTQLAKDRIRAEKQFRKNPHTYAQHLFKATNLKGEPAFSAEVAMEYFTKTYRDDKRDLQITPLPGISRPPPPKHPFNGTAPTLQDLYRIVRKKKEWGGTGTERHLLCSLQKMPLPPTETPLDLYEDLEDWRSATGMGTSVYGPATQRCRQD